MPATCRPLNDHLPSSASSKPVIRLKNVVLPAPLGPMSAVIAPRWISRCSTLTAVSPPKVRRTWSASTMGSGLGTPGRASIPERAARAASPWAPATALLLGIERQLPSVTEYALRAEDHQGDQSRAHEHEADIADVGWLQEVDPAGLDGLAEELTGAGQDDPEQDRANHGTHDAGCSAEQQDRVGEEGELRSEGVRLDRLLRNCPHDAAEGADDATQDECLEFVGEDVLTE